MLADYPVTLTLAASDLRRARDWYSHKLELKPAEDHGDVLVYRQGGSSFVLYETQFAGTAQNTVGIWDVPDLPRLVGELRGRGVDFAEPDFGEFRNVGLFGDGDEGDLLAWFQDSEANNIGLVQRPNDSQPSAIRPLLAAADLSRAKSWYAEKLDLLPAAEYEGKLLRYSNGGGFSIYASPKAGTARNTVAGWQVPDLRGLAAELRARGVKFEDYDFGDSRTIEGILANPDGSLNSWIRDSEANILAIDQDPTDRVRTRARILTGGEMSTAKLPG